MAGVDNIIISGDAGSGSDRALYYCYGSNLLEARMHVNIKSAVKHSVGRLDGHRFGFSGHSDFWGGATANIIPDPDAQVVGVIWSIEASDLIKLDKQEAGYNRVSVDVFVDGDHQRAVRCWTYIQKDQEKTKKAKEAEVKEEVKAQRQPESLETVERNQASTGGDGTTTTKGNQQQQPSAVYKEIIVRGAEQHQLPPDYIEMIKKFSDNGVRQCSLSSLLDH